jgi:hypothetical protein
VTRGDLWRANIAERLVELIGIEPTASRVRLCGKRALWALHQGQSRLKRADRPGGKRTKEARCGQEKDPRGPHLDELRPAPRHRRPVASGRAEPGNATASLLITDRRPINAATATARGTTGMISLLAGGSAARYMEHLPGPPCRYMMS